MPTPPTPPSYWWLTVQIDACRTRDERVAAASGDDAVRMWRELHPNVEVIHVRPVPELVDIELEHMSTNNNTDPIRGVPPLLAARAALAEPDGPAVPEGREPASVAGEASDEELLDEWGKAVINFPGESWSSTALAFARAVLARWSNRQGFLDSPAPVPVATPLKERPDFLAGYRAGLHDGRLEHLSARPAPAPAEGEVGELVAALKVIDKMQWEWILLGDDDGTASPSLTMPISLRRFTVIRAALTRAADLLEQRQAAPVPVPVSERLPGPGDCDAQGRCWLLTVEMDCLYTSHWLPFNALPLPTTEPQP